MGSAAAMSLTGDIASNTSQPASNPKAPKVVGTPVNIAVRPPDSLTVSLSMWTSLGSRAAGSSSAWARGESPVSMDAMLAAGTVAGERKSLKATPALASSAKAVRPSVAPHGGMRRRSMLEATTSTTVEASGTFSSKPLERTIWGFPNATRPPRLDAVAESSKPTTLSGVLRQVEGNRDPAGAAATGDLSLQQGDGLFSVSDDADLCRAFAGSPVSQGKLQLGVGSELYRAAHRAGRPEHDGALRECRPERRR